MGPLPGKFLGLALALIAYGVIVFPSTVGLDHHLPKSLTRTNRICRSAPIRSEKRTIAINVPHKPDRAGIDPRWSLIVRSLPALIRTIAVTLPFDSFRGAAWGTGFSRRVAR